VATGATADDLKFPLTLAAHAKTLAKQHGVNESLVDTRDIALAYVDRFAGSGAEASAAYTNILAWDLPLGT
jgi:hypothetical protein